MPLNCLPTPLFHMNPYQDLRSKINIERQSWVGMNRTYAQNKNLEQLVNTVEADIFQLQQEQQQIKTLLWNQLNQNR